jgi:hypothetical protein
VGELVSGLPDEATTRDYNGERGPVPFPPFTYDWRQARRLREWFEELHREIRSLDITERRP